MILCEANKTQSPSIQTTPTSQTAEELYQEALIENIAKNYQEALSKVDAVLKLEPNYPPAITLRDKVSLVLGRQENGDITPDSSSDISPEEFCRSESEDVSPEELSESESDDDLSEDELVWDSELLSYSSESERERKNLLENDQILKTYPNHFPTLWRSIRSLMRLRRDDEAVERLDACLKIESAPHDLALHFKSELLRYIGRNSEALESCHALLKIDPDRNRGSVVCIVDALKMSYEILVEQGRYGEALAICEALSKIKPNNANELLITEAFELRCKILMRREVLRALRSDDVDEVKTNSIFHHLLNKQPVSAANVDELFNKAILHLWKDEYSELLSELDEILKIQPNHRNALRLRGFALISLEDRYLSSKKTEYLKIQPNDYLSNGMRARALHYHGKYSKALESCDAMLKINPNSAWGLALREYIARAVAKTDLFFNPSYFKPTKKALLQFDQFLSRKPLPNASPPIPAKLEVDSTTNQQPIPVTTNVVTQELSSDQRAEQLFAEGKNLYNKNKHEDALLKFDQFLKVQPNHSEALSLRAKISDALEEQLVRAVGHWKDEFEETVSTADQFLKSRPNDPQTLRFRGKALFCLARYNEALENCNALLKIDPNDAQILRVKKLTLRALGSKDVLAADLSNSSSDKVAEESFNEVAWHYEKGEYEEAILKANQLLKIRRKDLATLRLRGEALFALGRYEQALESCNTCLEVDQNDTVALRIKAQSLLGLGRDKEALAACDAYLKIVPNDARGLTIRDMASYPLKELPTAKPVVLNPPSLNVVLDDANVHYEQGIKLSEAGTYQEAITEYSRAIELNPSEPLYYKQRARCLEAIGDFSAALLDYKKVIELENQGVVVERAEEQTALKKEDRLLETRLQLTQANLHDNKLAIHELEVQRKQIQQLQQDRSMIQSLLNASKSERLAEREFKKHPNLWTHYRQVKLKLEEVFSGCKSVASGFITHQQKGTMGNVGTGINLVGKVASLLPVIGNTLGGIFSAGSSAVNDLDYLRQQNILTDISALGSVMELMNISENVARELTNRYRDQLLLLSGSEEEAYSVQQRNAVKRLGKVKTSASLLADTAQEKALVIHKKDQAQKVAEYAVLKMLEGLQDGHIAQNINTTIEDQLIKMVMGLSSIGRTERLSQ